MKIFGVRVKILNLYGGVRVKILMNFYSDPWYPNS